MHTSKSSPLLKIILMVGVAIAVFVAFMVYSLKTSVKNSEQLTTIKELYFPILERIDANIVRIDKMEERFMQAVMTGERDELDTVAQHARQADAVFQDMQALYPAQASAIQNLQAKLAAYFEQGHALSLALLQRHTADQAGLSQRMNQSLSELRESVQQFRTESYDQFAHTLKASQAAATQTLYLGIAVGIMNLFFMAVLVYFIRNNIRMMALIAEHNATLENRVAERTAELSQKTSDIHAMLDNMSLGVCTIVPGSLIHPEYSAHLCQIFREDELAGRDMQEALFSAARLGVDRRDQLGVALEAMLGEDQMMFACNQHLLVREMELEWPEGTRTLLQLDWNPITNPEDQVEKVLLIVQDVTALRDLEQASARQKEELDMIARLLRMEPDKFSGFIRSARQLLEDNRRLIETAGAPDPDIYAALFRNMHTLKGNARTFELDLVTDAAHTAEQTYDHLRKDPDFVFEPATLRQELDAVAQSLQRYVTVSEDQLGRRQTDDAAHGSQARVEAGVLAELRRQALGLLSADAPPAWRELARQVSGLGLIDLTGLIGDVMRSTRSLAEELHKPPPRYSLEAVNLALTPVFAEALQSALIHLVRNALDHGIEPPAERQAQGKPGEGLIRFRCRRQTDTVQLVISDDGRGLALQSLYSKGLARGRFAGDTLPPLQDIANLVFESGLSTAAAVSQVSGRGVGMDAARALLRDQGGELEIALPDHGDRRVHTPFEFIITLPAAVWSPQA
ncbi:hypothetical protein FJZ55_00140 [Candidatus Woesearchaeota archaeon]|jgi:HPt (histidine-containing phosphotransfer) domain-containing protein|nr:hypothetical protein [Candidatus Woesearchaeota archaeon]